MNEEYPQIVIIPVILFNRIEPINGSPFGPGGSRLEDGAEDLKTVCAKRRHPVRATTATEANTIGSEVEI